LKAGEKKSDEALQNIGPIGANEEVVPTDEARALAAYLISLRSEAVLFETPPPPTNKVAAVSTNAAAAATTNAPAATNAGRRTNEQRSSTHNGERRAKGGDGGCADCSCRAVCVVVLRAAVYVNNHGGGFNAKVYQPYASYAMVDNLQVVDPMKNSRGRESLFSRTTARCATRKTARVWRASFRRWQGRLGQLPVTHRILRAVLYGLTGPITVSESSLTARCSVENVER